MRLCWNVGEWDTGPHWKRQCRYQRRVRAHERTGGSVVVPGQRGRWAAQFHPEPIQAEEFLKEICEESEMIDHRHQYTLVKKWSGDIQADVAMLKQAIRILIDNAVKYTPEGGRITLRLEQCGNGRIGIGVQDEGIGLEAEEAAHMFERFFRGDAVRGTTQGSGLGLSIAKWIADRHHAVIEVVSFKDVGTRITIQLPEM